MCLHVACHVIAISCVCYECNGFTNDQWGLSYIVGHTSIHVYM